MLQYSRMVYVSNPTDVTTFEFRFQKRNGLVKGKVVLPISSMPNRILSLGQQNQKKKNSHFKNWKQKENFVFFSYSEKWIKKATSEFWALASWTASPSVNLWEHSFWMIMTMMMKMVDKLETKQTNIIFKRGKVREFRLRFFYLVSWCQLDGMKVLFFYLIFGYFSLGSRFNSLYYSVRLTCCQCLKNFFL